MGETVVPMITIIREITSELYVNEDVEMKAIVASKMAEADALDLNEENGAGGLQRTSQQFQECVVFLIRAGVANWTDTIQL